MKVSEIIRALQEFEAAGHGDADVCVGVLIDDTDTLVGRDVFVQAEGFEDEDGNVRVFVASGEKRTETADRGGRHIFGEWTSF